MAVKRFKKKSRIGLTVILLIVLAICGFVFWKTYKLGIERESLQGQLAQIESQTEHEKRRNLDIINEIKYRNTDDYIEDQARDMFGLRSKDETIFKPGDVEKNQITDNKQETDKNQETDPDRETEDDEQ